MPKINKTKVNKKEDKKKPIKLKRIDHKPIFIYSFREHIDPQNDYQLHLVYSFDNDHYRCDIEVYGNYCDVVFANNSPFVNKIYKCQGAVAQYSIRYDKHNDVIWGGGNARFIVFVIMFYDDIFDKCLKVIYLKFPDKITSNSNRNSPYLIFSINNIKVQGTTTNG